MLIGIRKLIVIVKKAYLKRSLFKSAYKNKTYVIQHNKTKILFRLLGLNNTSLLLTYSIKIFFMKIALAIAKDYIVCYYLVIEQSNRSLKIGKQ